MTAGEVGYRKLQAGFVTAEPRASPKNVQDHTAAVVQPMTRF